ncbi:hypothetical protein AOLI_G00232360 [Acnodon oligacanthus]
MISATDRRFSSAERPAHHLQQAGYGEEQNGHLNEAAGEARYRPPPRGTARGLTRAARQIVRPVVAVTGGVRRSEVAGLGLSKATD